MQQIRTTPGSGSDLLSAVVLNALTNFGIVQEGKPLSPLLSNNEVMNIFGISKGTLRNWIRRGKLNPLRMSHKKVFFRQSDIQALIEQESE